MTPRSIKLTNYDIATASIEFEVSDVNLMMDFLRVFKLESSIKFSKGREIVKIENLNQLYDADVTANAGVISYIETFLNQFKKIAIVYGQDHWITFVTELRNAANVKKTSWLAGTPLFNRNLLLDSKFKHNCLSSIYSFLDMRSLARQTQVALGAVQREAKGRRDTAADAKVQAKIDQVWEQHAEKHYPSSVPFNLTRYPMPISKSNYKTRYLASDSNSRRRVILQAVITGNCADPTLSSLTLAELKQPNWDSGGRRSIVETARRNHQQQLLSIWWNKHIVPFYTLNGHTFDFNKKDDSHFSILDWAILLKQSEMVQLLLKSNLNLNETLALHSSCTLKDLSLFKIFIKEKIAVDQLSPNFVTPLITAAWYGFVEGLELLLTNKAEVNYRDPENRTALMYAAWRDKSEAVLQLLGAGADYKLANDCNETALHWAIQNNDRISFKALLAKQAEDKLGIDSNPLLSLPEAGRPFVFALRHRNEYFAQQLLNLAAQQAEVLYQVLMDNSGCVLSLAADLPNHELLKNILMQANRFNMAFPEEKIIGILDKVKNNLEILKLLEIMTRGDLQSTIREHRKAANCHNLVHQLTHSTSSCFFAKLGFKEVPDENDSQLQFPRLLDEKRLHSVLSIEEFKLNQSSRFTL